VTRRNTGVRQFLVDGSERMLAGGKKLQNPLDLGKIQGMRLNCRQARLVNVPAVFCKCLARETSRCYSAARMALAMMTRIWRDMIPAVAGLVPVGVISVYLSWDRKRRSQRIQSPQEEKLLRPPGRSLSMKLVEVGDRAVMQLLKAAGLCFIGGVFFVTPPCAKSNCYP
jgi:hypothetical protein